MCGITGFLQQVRDPREIIGRMTDTLQHRGPDEGGIWCDETAGIALGHRRLSILDLSPAGSQPMLSSTGNHVLCFNGEIYNFGELRPELEQAGYQFRGHSDSEVLLAALVLWGPDEALRRVDGMFAFALWDRTESTLLLARDRVGKKPLYYGWCNKTFLFGSELKALRAHPDFDTTIDRNALGEYVRYGWVPDPLSIHAAIRKLPPGCLLRIRPESPPWSAAPEYYWRAGDVCRRSWARRFAGNFRDAVDVLDTILNRAVGTRMVADVELGALLSGGIDSTTVVAMMQRQANRPVKTFSIGFTEPRFNEAEQAAAIAAHLGTDHHELYVTPQQCLDLVGQLPHIYDEPFADISQVPTLLVSRLAQREVKVVLSGDGGDELFCGYTHYFEALAQWRWMQRFPAPARRWLRGLAQRYAESSWRWFAPSGQEDRRLRGWQRLGSRLEKRTRGIEQNTVQGLILERSSRCTHPARLVIGAGQADTVPSDAARWVSGVDPLLQMRQLDYIGYLPGDILVKVDRASMAVGLEVRAPLLDTSVTEFAWGLPREFLIDPSGGKRILREVMHRYVPEALTDRPKRGFSAPVEDWLRDPLRDWAEDLLDSSRLAREGFLEPGAVREIWKQHLAGWRNHSNLLWSLLMFQAWLASVS